MNGANNLSVMRPLLPRLETPKMLLLSASFAAPMEARFGLRVNEGSVNKQS